MWYRLAEANGVGSDRELLVGQALSIPSGVGSSRNSAETFKPYDPSKITGDTSPNLPAPAASGGGDDCGGLGQILMIVVAVAVTWATAGALFEVWGAVGAGAAGGAAGAATSQVVGNATGVIDGFDWKGIALGALGGAVTAGVAGNAEALGLTGQTFGAVAARAAISNALTQGIAVVSGLQKSAAWRPVPWVRGWGRSSARRWTSRTAAVTRRHRSRVLVLVSKS